jgi:hypothetical protein
MTRRPPAPALWLTAAGALPFLIGAAMILGAWPAEGRALVIAYGTVILCFMSGVLWGFAARHGAEWWPYAASVLPALYVFFFVQTHGWSLPGQALTHLMLGFAVVLVLDAACQWRGLAPRWWLTLRVPVTVVVLACLWIARGA